jgi:hypothetical protein
MVDSKRVTIFVETHFESDFLINERKLTVTSTVADK